MESRRRIQAVLFDLDGTLLDSAPGLTAATNAMRARRGLLQLMHEHLRPHAGSGARGMLAAAFGLLPDHDGYESMRDEFYVLYADCMLHDTRPFAFIGDLLATLDRHGLPWGIVTNKAHRFAEPSISAMGWSERVGALVAGDTTPHTKPHPAPLLEAARRMQQPPSACLYVGDDARDVRAGQAAGMATAAAAWGYLGPEGSVDAWGADRVLLQPNDLLQMLELA